ncbi:MAG TPA: hypothetical protein VI039_07050 [Solirubrobacterales bacterium]
MSSAWCELDLAGPDPDEEEHVEGDNTEIVEKEAAAGENKRKAR